MRKIKYENFSFEEVEGGVEVYNKDHIYICTLSADYAEGIEKDDLFSGDESKAKRRLDKAAYFMEITSRQLTKLIS